MEAVLSEMDEAGKENLRVMLPKKGLSLLASEVCRVHKVTLEELRSGSRRHEVVRGRGELSQVAIKLFGYSGARSRGRLG